MSKQDSKLRVYEYAKSLNMSSKEIITILKKLDIPVNNHMSVMENGSVAKVEQFFNNIKAGAAVKREQSSSAQTVATSAVREDQGATERSNPSFQGGATQNLQNDVKNNESNNTRNASESSNSRPKNNRKSR